MAATHVLLVEDDEGIARPLAAALRGEGYAVTHVTTGRKALDAVGESTDAVVLDLGLPDIDGIEVCQRLRNGGYRTLPILMLTARTGELDVVVGLDAGADDYVPKPFRLAELLARLRALLRRTGADGHELLEAQDVRVDPDARRVWKGEEELELTPKEFELLVRLVQDAGTVVSRETLMRDVWETDWMGNTKTLDMHVSTLRRKLGDDPSSPRYVTTVRGVGLRFET